MATVDEKRQENYEFWLQQDQELLKRREEAYNVGGQKQIDRMAKQGKMTVRELIARLIDPDTDFYELGLDAGYNIGYKEQAHIPGGGLVTGVGKVHGKDCMIFGNESRMTAGTYYPTTLKKHMRAQKIAEQCGLTCIYIADSGGLFLPLQLGGFADEGMFGSMFYNMTRMSARGIKQYTLSTGGNTAGGAYIVYLACESIMIDKLAYAFLAGPPMVRSAIGEDVSAEDLGGAYVHTQHSGGCDHFVRTQDEGIAKLREIIAFDPPQKSFGHRYDQWDEPLYGPEELMSIMPSDPYKPINIHEVIKCIADGSYFQEYKPNYAPGRGDNIICGKMWIKGMPIGVVASNKTGVIFIESARKATEWVVRCGNDKTPLLYIQNSPGYMVGRNEEWGGIGKYGSDMVRACACVEVPKIQWVIGPDHGAANYGMCGRAYNPRFVFHTMRARTTVMSGKTAGFILETIERKNKSIKGEQVDEEKMTEFREKMIERYDREGHPYLTGSLLFHDGIITWPEARDKIARGFELALRRPIPDSHFGNFKF
jgi:3-methylcrotonyl-CoA carboxylase beta subunit